MFPHQMKSSRTLKRKRSPRKRCLVPFSVLSLLLILPVCIKFQVRERRERVCVCSRGKTSIVAIHNITRQTVSSLDYNDCISERPWFSVIVLNRAVIGVGSTEFDKTSGRVKGDGGEVKRRFELRLRQTICFTRFMILDVHIYCCFTRFMILDVHIYCCFTRFMILDVHIYCCN